MTELMNSWPNNYIVNGEIINEPPEALIFARDDEDEIDSVFSLLRDVDIKAAYLVGSHLLEGRVASLPYVELPEGAKLFGLNAITKFVEERKIKH